MRKGLAVMLGVVVMCSSAWAFDYSPTQTPKKVTRTAPAQIDPKLVQGILSDDVLAKGAELVVVSQDGARSESLQGTLSEPLSGDMAKMTKKYLMEHASVFNIPVTKDENLVKLVSNVEAAGANHFFYQMNLGGVPVQDSMIDLHVGKDNRIQLANGSFPTVKEITNQITLGRIEAIAAAKRALGAKSVRGAPKAEMTVVPANGKGTMAFLVKMATDKPLGDWEILIDAETGKEISRLNQMVYARRASGNTGKGTVYVNHPMISSATTEELLHLESHTLSGEFADVYNEDTDRATSETDEYITDPDNTHFDETMIYFHINRIHDFFKSIGHDKMDRPMKATVHVGDKYDNAYYSPMEDAMSFGDGNKLNDLSKEETVCYHEYSHAALNPIVKLNYSNESGAINEGQADYFACSYTNDPKLGEYVMNKLGKPYLRIMENSLHYPEDVEGEVHADGRIWGAVLWDIRAALGAQVSDPLIHKSFYYLKPGSPKFAHAAGAIMTADKNLFQSAHKDQLLEVFKKRGINVTTLEGTILGNKELNRMKTFRSVHEE